MNRVYCLYRVSHRGQVEKNDIPMQKIACYAFAQERGWEIAKEFSEQGVSGYKLTMKERDAIMEIREAALAGKFEILLVYMFDRIGRRDDETPFVVEWLVRQGISVWSVCEGEQRFDNHVDKLTNYIRYWQAAGESEKISERTRTRIRQLTQEGAFTGGCCPYGYSFYRGDRVNKKNQPMNDLRICESEAEVVRLIFEKTKREGLGPHRIANFLNEQGLTTRKGKRWNQASVQNVLRNRLYLGYIQKGGVVSPHRPELQIIDEETFEEVQHIRESRLEANRTQNTEVTFHRKGRSLLNGFAFCGHCGARLSGASNRREYRRKDGSIYRRDKGLYRCNASIDGVPTDCDGQRTYRSQRVDDNFKEIISAILKTLEAIPVEDILEYKFQIALADKQRDYNESQEYIRQKKQEQKMLQAEIVKVLRDESVFSPIALQAAIQDTQLQIEAREKYLCELEEKLHNAEQLRREIEIRQLKYCGLKQAFETGTLDEKKQLLSIMIHRVEISRNYEMNIKLAPGFEQFIDGLIELR